MFSITIQVPVVDYMTIKIYAKKNALSLSSVFRQAVINYINDNAELKNIKKELVGMNYRELANIHDTLDNIKR